MDSESKQSSSASLVRDAALGIALFSIAVALPLLVADHYGALRIPRSDDWSYYRTLFDWHRTGRWDFNYWVSMTLVGQVIITKPIVMIFGTNIAAIRVFTATLGAIGLGAVACLGRPCRLQRRDGLFIAIVVASGPLWGSLAATYMTDVPAFAFQMIAMSFAARGLTQANLERAGTSVRMFAISVTFSVVAISIRQYAAVTFIAIVATYAATADLRSRPQLKRAVIIVTGAALVALALLFHWWGTIPHPRALSPAIPNSGSLQLAYESAGGFLRLAGLMLLPIVAFANPIRAVREVWKIHGPVARWMTFAATLVLVSSYAMQPEVPFVGNYFDRRGVLADDIIAGTRPPIMARPLFEILVVLASLSAFVLVMLAVPLIDAVRHRVKARSIHVDDPITLLLALTLFGFAFAYELAIVCNLPIFDRYALPALAPAALLVRRQQTAILHARQSKSVGSAWRVWLPASVAFALVAFLGVMYTAEAASYDGTRWAVAEAAVRAGYAVQDVHGGYEWVGYRLHRSPRLEPTVALQKKQRKQYFSGLCVTVVINPPSRPREIVATKYAIGWLRNPTPVYAIRGKLPCAIPPTAPHTQARP